MVTIAIAGSGNISKQILKALLANNPKQHKIVLLSTSPNKEHPILAALSGTLKHVDYHSPESLVSALEGVHTVVSTLGPSNPLNAAEAFGTSQLALLAAAKAAGVRRFAPSEWTTSYAANRDCDIYNAKMEVWDAVRDSGLEYTAFRPGVFMNFLGHGSPHPDVLQECFDGLPDYPFDIDLAAGTARIPGTGNEQVAFTRTQDIGKFAVAALDLPDGTWPKITGFAGWVGTYHELIEVAEEVTGKKLQRTYVSVDELEEMLKTAEHPMMKIGIQSQLLLAKGDGVPEDLSFGYSIDANALTVKEFFQKWWA